MTRNRAPKNVLSHISPNTITIKKTMPESALFRRLFITESFFAMLSSLWTEDLLYVCSHDDFLVNQDLCQFIKSGPVVLEQLSGLPGYIICDCLGFSVNQLGGLLAIRLCKLIAITAG